MDDEITTVAKTPATGNELELIQRVIEGVLRMYDLPAEVDQTLRDASDEIQQATIYHFPIR